MKEYHVSFEKNTKDASVIYSYYYGRHESNTSQLTFQLLIKLQSYLFMYSGRKCTFGRKKI